ncbi:cytochrome CBB3 [Pseudohongiella nitratireducens]|uniref:Cytochrome CBB3 n=1 Tax=Pseudohongiella nitratireducens TaxID=1768907 RepID=A0A917LPE7_9GAMM|nr:PQQ-binding-like beta-propeller repeat protein [Pseudohongiella nitratireducens]GGG47971.1 cytochrome CBB3 [Pseudohongiella nitratireducens]
MMKWANRPAAFALLLLFTVYQPVQSQAPTQENGQSTSQTTTQAVTQTSADNAGEQLFAQHCAACHEGGDPRAPSLASLNTMSADDLRFALTGGVMSAQGQSLNESQLAILVEHLARDPVSDNWIAANRCSDERMAISLDKASLASPGGGLEFGRQLSASQSGLQKSNLSALEVAWSIVFPGVGGLRSSPVITEDTLFYPAASSTHVFAIDVASGCIKWSYDAGTSLRGSAVLGETVSGEQANKQALLYVTDERARLHAINPIDGEPVWVRSGVLDDGMHTRLTGAPVVFESRLYLPVSASGVQRGALDTHECCDGRGGVIALDAMSGEEIWRYVTMPPADYTGERNPAGTRLRGPSGAPVWASPSLDTERRQLYITTGENTSLPATDTSNAFIALDIDSGEVVWQFQAVANDVWNMACTGREYGANCPTESDSIRKDWDFGSAPALVTLASGEQRLLAGQKSGHLWALNPANGEVLWQQRVGDGGALGGNHWGIAHDGERVFLPISDPGPYPSTDRFPGVYAFDLMSGEPVWSYSASPACESGRQRRVDNCDTRFGFSAMPLVVDEVVVAGAVDGRLYLFDSENGSVLGVYDTAVPFQGDNGIPGHGGSLDAHTISAGSGMIFVGSGYNRFSQREGNVLIAYRPR